MYSQTARDEQRISELFVARTALTLLKLMPSCGRVDEWKGGETRGAYRHDSTQQTTRLVGRVPVALSIRSGFILGYSFSNASTLTS